MAGYNGVFLETACQTSLYSSCLQNSNHPRSRRELFNRHLARTILPGASLVADAGLDISLILKSSIHTTGGGEPGKAQVDPHGRGGWVHWLASLPLGLNRDMPRIPPPGHGDLSWCSPPDLPAVDKPNLSLFICLAYLHKVNYTLVYGDKQRDSNRRSSRFQYARPSGVCGRIPENSVGRKSYRNTPGSVIPGEPKGMMFCAVRATLPLPAALHRTPLSGTLSNSNRRRSNSLPLVAPA